MHVPRPISGESNKLPRKKEPSKLPFALINCGKISFNLHFKVECFSTKMLKFQHDDVIIYDVSRDFGTLFGMWNRLAMSYPCAKFHCDRTINNM